MNVNVNCRSYASGGRCRHSRAPSPGLFRTPVCIEAQRQLGTGDPRVVGPCGLQVEHDKASAAPLPWPRRAAPEVRVVYVSPERAVHEVKKVALEIHEPLRTLQHFADFSEGRLGWRLAEVLQAAVTKGEGTFGGPVHGAIWPRDEKCRSAFEAALRKAGFVAEYKVYESDGPEADTFVYIICPTGGTAKEA